MSDKPTSVDLTPHVKGIRQKLGLSQKQFAELIGVTQSAVSKWENGSQRPDLDSTLKMQGAAGLKEQMAQGQIEHRYQSPSWGISVRVIGAINESKWSRGYRWDSKNTFNINVPKRAAWEGHDLLGFLIQDDSAYPVYPRESIIVCSGFNLGKWLNPRTGDNIVVAERHPTDALVRVVVRQFALGRKGEHILNSYGSQSAEKKFLTTSQRLDILAAGGFEAIGFIGVIVGGFIVEDPDRFVDPEF